MHSRVAVPVTDAQAARLPKIADARAPDRTRARRVLQRMHHTVASTIESAGAASTRDIPDGAAVTRHRRAAVRSPRRRWELRAAASPAQQRGVDRRRGFDESFPNPSLARVVVRALVPDHRDAHARNDEGRATNDESRIRT